MSQPSLSETIAFYDLRPAEEGFGDALRAGLSRSPKSLPCKFFYDQRGSRLFDQICTLDEYYVTRTETALIERAMSSASPITRLVLVPGAGSSS